MKETMITSSTPSIFPSRKARGIKTSQVLSLLLAAFSMPTGSSQAAGINYSTTIQPIYNSSCIECHPPDGGMNLTSGMSYANTVNKAAMNTGRAPYRVRPDFTTKSAIWVIANAGGHNGATVTPAQLANITDWINQGALLDLSAPTVSSVAPSSGGTAGGTAVTVTGTKFGGIGAFVPAVTFGGVPATNVVVTEGSFTEIKCTTPPHAAGGVDVVVTTTAGGASAPLINGFTYTGSLPTVTMKVIDGSASEVPSTDTGKVQIIRTGATTSALTVFYTIGGTATNGVDYRKLKGQAIIKSGKTLANVVVQPIDDTIPEPDETVILTLSPNASYTIGSPNSGTVTIHSNE